MFEVKAEAVFKQDYKRAMRRHPHLRAEFKAALEELFEYGAVSDSYSPHILDNANGNYNGHIDFHLSDGLVDVLVLYMPNKTNPIIRLVRMGSHQELFGGPLR